MRVFVIGSGAREHAICWKLRQSGSLTQLYAAPGNPGIADLAEIAPIAVDDVPALLAFARDNAVDLTVVGPELPLSLGIVDAFRAAGLEIFGPSRAAAQLESSKSFAKEVMVKAGVPTAGHRYFSDPGQAAAYVREHGAPIVLKADGLAAGKGVSVCMTEAEAQAALAELSAHYGGGIVVEDFLSGSEASFIVATNGSTVVPLATTHDYKRIGENDHGPNTGGMGSVSPTPRLTTVQSQQVIDRVVRPVLQEMERRGTPFSGFLYAGLMIGDGGEISVLEFNTRLGDPECQSIMRRMDDDLLELMLRLNSQRREGFQVEQLQWSDDACVCVVLASKGYPQSTSKGDLISGVKEAENLPGVVVFHAGTRRDQHGALLTDGGRVISVTALGNDMVEARQLAYQGTDKIAFNGRQLRRDIGL